MPASPTETFCTHSILGVDLSRPIGPNRILHEVREQMLSYSEEIPVTALAPWDTAAAILAPLYLTVVPKRKIGLPQCVDSTHAYNT